MLWLCIIYNKIFYWINTTGMTHLRVYHFCCGNCWTHWSISFSLPPPCLLFIHQTTNISSSTNDMFVLNTGYCLSVMIASSVRGSYLVLSIVSALRWHRTIVPQVVPCEEVATEVDWQVLLRILEELDCRIPRELIPNSLHCFLLLCKQYNVVTTLCIFRIFYSTFQACLGRCF